MSNFYELSQKQVRFNDDVSTLLGLKRIADRRLFLYGEVFDISAYAETVPDAAHLSVSDITRIIYEINLEDAKLEKEFYENNPTTEKFERKPILLFIDSPGGDIGEGFALVDMIKLSKTPVWTVNLGEWSSMGFLLGITGHRRFSLPHATFLWHDGSTGYFGSSEKGDDTAAFNKHYRNTVVKNHIIDCARPAIVDKDHPKEFTDKFYDKHVREEYYMLPETALRFGFIDEILTDLSALFLL